MVKLTEEGEKVRDIIWRTLRLPMTSLGLSIKDLRDLGLIESHDGKLTGDELRSALARGGK